MTRQEAIALGFEEVPHFTVGHTLVYMFGRGRHLSLGSLGTPNEVLFVCQADRAETKRITDLVCLHNYDYDGYMTVDRLKSLVEWVR